MARRALKTGYILNRGLKRVALIAAGVAFPSTAGVWEPVADALCPRPEVTSSLPVAYLDLLNDELKYVALLSDLDVIEYEAEITASSRYPI